MRSAQLPYKSPQEWHPLVKDLRLTARFPEGPWRRAKFGPNVDYYLIRIGLTCFTVLLLLLLDIVVLRACIFRSIVACAIPRALSRRLGRLKCWVALALAFWALGAAVCLAYWPRRSHHAA